MEIKFKLKVDNLDEKRLNLLIKLAEKILHISVVLLICLLATIVLVLLF